jgi:aspartate/methionine/tyrosine aminotransferase
VFGRNLQENAAPAKTGTTIYCAPMRAPADAATEINAALEREAPALFAALSPLGRRAFLQDEDSEAPAAPRGALTEASAAAFTGLDDPDLEAALAASPVAGLPEVRRRWRDWQRRDLDASAASLPSSLPLVTAGLSHALAVAADLFGGEGRAVAVPQPFWGNYRQAFAVRTGARVLTAPAYVGGRFNPRAVADALAGLPDREPAVGILNLPSNPGGYSATPAERAAIRDSLVAAAERRPLVVLCDDAYAGLVFEPGVPAASMFWELIGAHASLVPVKVDGATKEFSFFGGRVGFLTFALTPDSAAALALASKVACLVRSSVGVPIAASQVVLLQALRRPDIEHEIEEVRALLAGRYRALQQALAAADAGLLTTLPFNSGCFALVELPERLGVDSEALRRHLLEHHDTGLVAIEPRYLRIAHCSVDAAALPELVRRLEQGVRELARS